MFGLKTSPIETIRVLELFPDAEKLAPRGVLTISETWQFGILRQGDCTAEQAKLAESLWNELPVGEAARCHIPGFAIQAIVNGEAVFSAAICWKCNNASIAGRLATETWRSFDAGSQEAQALLALCKQVVQRDPQTQRGA